MNIAKNTFIDFDQSDISQALILKLVHNRLYDYEDQILKEHIYGEIEGLKDRAKSEGVKFTKAEKSELAGISKIMDVRKACYFRIIF